MRSLTPFLCSAAVVLSLAGCSKSEHSAPAPAPPPPADAPALPAPQATAVAGIAADDAARLYEIAVVPDGDGEATRVRANFPLAEARPSGLWAAPGETITVEVGPVPAGVTVAARIGVWGDRARAEGTNSLTAVPTETRLSAGTNSITDAVGGPIHLKATTTDPGTGVQVPARVRLRIQGGSALPIFRAGLSSIAQWRTAAMTTVSPFVELLTPRALLTLPTAEVRNVLLATADAELLQTLDAIGAMAASHDRVAGLNHEAGLHRPRQNLLHFTAHWDPIYYMYAFYRRMAFCADVCLPFLLGEAFITSGWGPWHEAGHMYQGAWEWSALTEVSVNIFSLEFEHHLGRPHRLTSENVAGMPGVSHWDHALALRSSVARYEDLSVFERLVPFWQLRLAYGVEFWARLHHAYRDPATRPELGDDESRRQAFIVEASRVAGQDLGGYFAAWGLRALPDTERRLAALALPPADVAALLALRP